MTERTPEADNWMAAHEAGHASMSFLLGRRVGVVSIVPTEHFGGITFHTGSKLAEGELGDLYKPVVLQPARFRRWVETEVLIRLAGPAAALASPFMGTRAADGYIPEEPDELEAQRLAKAAILTPVEATQLERAGTEPGERDDESAEGFAWVIAGERSAASYLSWLRFETDHVVRSPRFAALVEALVPVLLLRRTISGRLARQVLVDASRTTTTPSMHDRWRWRAAASTD
jgi:hypothetical protein